MPTSWEQRELFRPLEGLFAEIWQAVDAPDYQGGRWLELYRGSAFDDTFIVVDFVWNVLHVRREGRERLTVTFLPGWFYQHVTLALTQGLRTDSARVNVEDLASAGPLRFELTQEAAIPGAEQCIDGVEFTRLPFGYEFEPARAFALDDGGSVERPHWCAMKLRLVAAPGVGVTARPVMASADIERARAAYDSDMSGPTSAQALQFELERRQDPWSIPVLGAPWRNVPLAEIDLVAGSVASQPGCALVLEQTRPDGVDILVARPGESSGSAPWLAELAAEAARGIVDAMISFQGGIAPDAPILVRIRVPPSSAKERFAYRLTYLDRYGQPSDGPTEDVDAFHACVRLSVVRTAGVHVSVNAKLDDQRGQLAEIVEYHEKVAAFEDVPCSLTADTEPVRRAVLPDEPATIEDLLSVAYYAGAFAPIPQLQAMYDMEDAASLGMYLLYGTDVWGEEMTALDAGITVAGLVLPEAAERGLKGISKSVRRLKTIGDDPFARLVRASESLKDDDTVLAQELVSRVEAE